MITDHKSRNRRLRSAFFGIVLTLFVLGNPSAGFAAGWSPEVTIFPLMQSTAPNAFAINSSGNELWVTASLANFTMTVTAAQRAFGGAWSSPTTIASVRATSLPITVALSANNYAAAAWQDAIALRSPAGVWQAPVHLGLTGSVSNFQVKLDAQGNGVAVWGRLTDTNTLVEAVTWTANGNFGSVVQLSPHRTERSGHNWPSTMLERPWSSGWHPLHATMPTRIRLSRPPGLPGGAGVQSRRPRRLCRRPGRRKWRWMGPATRRPCG